MIYFKDKNDNLHALEDKSFAHLLPPGSVEIPESEALRHREPTRTEIIAALTAALERHYDATAQSHRYDNRFTCALRAGYPGPFRSEGLAFAEWMDDCNAYGYQVMADCEAGKRAIPTGDELVGELPAMVWP